MLMNSKITILLSIVSVVVHLCTLSAQAKESSWVGYYSGEEKLTEFGTGMSETYDCAVYLPGDIGFASGKSINGIRFAMQGLESTQGLKLWVASRLPETADKADVCMIDIDVEKMVNGQLHEVMLEENIWVPKNGLYVGYSFSSSDPFPLLTTPGATSLANGFYLRTAKTYKEWKDMSKFSSGNLALQVLVDGRVYANAAQVEPIGEVVAYPGSEIIMPVKVTNMGNAGIKSLEYGVSKNGESMEIATYHFSTPIKEIKQTGVVPLNFIADDKEGLSRIDFRILKVNGEENELSDKVFQEGSLISVAEGMPKNVVMEEFTGTWCGWCPRGMVAMEQLNKDFGNRFIGIAVHNNDPMAIREYSYIVESSVSSFPHGIIDRSVECDPFFGSDHRVDNEPSYGIYADIEKEIGMLTPAKITLNSIGGDENSLEFDVVANLSLTYDRNDNPNYRVAYVVLADSLTGDEPKWFQNNDFSLPVSTKYSGDPYLGWLTDEGQMIRGLKYNDVAIAAYEIENGYPLQTDGQWNAYEEKKAGSIHVNLANNKLVQNIENVYVAALLLDSVSGVIVNAAKTKIGIPSAVDIIPEDNYTENDIKEIYNVNGQKIDRMSKGINIVKYSNGKVKKIFVNN